jgi:hypothetical protein
VGWTHDLPTKLLAKEENLRSLHLRTYFARSNHWCREQDLNLHDLSANGS